MRTKHFYPTPIPAQPPVPPLPHLGVWFIVNALAIKDHEPESILCTQWRRKACVPVPMMFIGVRRVREGSMIDTEKVYHDADGVAIDIDYGRAFQPTRFITVWLMVSSAHKKPVHVLPSDAVEIKEQI